MDCTISKARLSPATLDAVIRNRYWLLAVEAPWNLRLLLNLAGDQSLIADTQGRYSASPSRTWDMASAASRTHASSAGKRSGRLAG
jgi:hypothetical protein